MSVKEGSNVLHFFFFFHILDWALFRVLKVQSKLVHLGGGVSSLKTVNIKIIKLPLVI